MCKKRKLVSFFVQLCCVIVFAQEIPPLKGYLPNEYNADSQNWSISQDSSKVIYIANNIGLLSFNGAEWKINFTPNRSVMRSVNVVNNRIYVGFYMQFGYYEKDEYGNLNYTSLSGSIDSDILEDEEFWQIESYKDWILFRSLNKIYLYNILTKEIQQYTSKNTINFISVIDDRIYYHVSNEGIYTLEEGKQRLYITNEILNKSKVVNISSHSQGFLVITGKNGMFIMNENAVKPFNTTTNTLLNDYTIYTAIGYNNNKSALGTISDGVLLLNEDGDIEHHINKEQGLSNNTILSLFEDNDKNLWLGTQHGMNFINYGSSLKVYNDRKGEVGKIYDAEQYNDFLYLGTNQGLFYKPVSGEDSFKMIPNTSGQVWELYEYDGTLFCGHDSGTFIINNNQARLISKEKGTWVFKEIPSNKNILLQGNYKGISVLERKNNEWNYKNKVKGFDFSSQFFEILNDKIFVNHEFKGVYELKINKDFNEFSAVKKLDTFMTNQASGLNSYRGIVYYASNQGFFSYDEKEQDFVRNDSISKIIYNDFISGRMSVNKQGIWMFGENNLVNLKKSQLNESLEINKIPFPSSSLSSSLKGFQKLSEVGNNIYLIGSTDGYVLLDINDPKRQKFNISITNIGNFKSNGDFIEQLSVNDSKDFIYNHNGLEIKYGVAFYDAMRPIRYQTRLIGRSNNWSDWSTNSSIRYENLPNGEYEFNVRAKVGDILSNNIATYSFSIKKPWYSSNLMIALYGLGILLFSFFMHNVYKRYYRKKELKLVEKNKRELALTKAQNEKEIVKMKNEQLQKDINSKSRELAASTMSVIKKNELLTKIKKHLIQLKEKNKVEPVLKIIDRSLDHNDNWKLFKEAFNNADRKFLKKLKKTHPNLSPNDIKLCAYLRLNLSSKEIAPLFNISARSVEIKRYRLRKKLNLSHEENLVKYILSL